MTQFFFLFLQVPFLMKKLKTNPRSGNLGFMQSRDSVGGI